MPTDSTILTKMDERFEIVWQQTKSINHDLLTKVPKMFQGLALSVSRQIAYQVFMEGVNFGLEKAKEKFPL